ncbi:MAG TPA: outer membrane lipid asymmetry maintenance protein MlaD [Candidatus Binataceae bacterium]|nr:outer membrane lipid asymmetry maintenance protein MlaD [Candidatus Binataceae bacterium]
MYASRTTQLIVGIFGVMGILALAILSLRLGRISLFPAPSYTIYANFDNVAGLKTNDAIEIAGVKVGKVMSISLNRERAKVQMQITEGVPIDDEAIAAIKTSGIIGDKYVSIALGGGDRDLKNGDTLRMTQSAFVLEDAIGQLINTSGGAGGASPSAKASATPTPKPTATPTPKAGAKPNS